MRLRVVIGFAVAVCVGIVGARSATAQSTPSTMAQAAKDSPELVGDLAKELGSTPEQAAGAAGSIFGFTKSQLKPEDFSKVAAAVPGMASLLKAAPKMGGSGASALGALGGSAAGLASLASSFNKLGLKPEMVQKAVPLITSFVTKYGGADVAKLLSNVLK
jgi:hypothetical protein